MVLITGTSGFLGKIISTYLSGSNYEIRTLGRSVDCDYVFDLSSDNIVLDKTFSLVIHCAGKAHSVPKSASERQAFFDVNVIGTKKLLKALEQSTLPKYFVFISTVAVYGIEAGQLINEKSPLGAKDPYGLSKIQAEQMIEEWCNRNKVICTILRLPLIAAANPPGNLKAMIKGIKIGYYFNISGGLARKSMVLAEDVAKVIPIAAQVGGVYNLTDGHHPSFSELSLHIANQLKVRRPSNLPKVLAVIFAFVGDFFRMSAPINSQKYHKIISDLTFDDSKARELLNWNPRPVLDAFRVK